MSPSEPVVFLKDRLLPASQAHLNIYDMGLILGATFTEMTRTFKHKPFRLDDHMDRLFHSLKYANIRPVLLQKDLIEKTLELVAHNTKLLPAESDMAITHFVTPGENLIYAGLAATLGPLTPTVCIHSFPLPFKAWGHLLTEGAHMVTPSVRHVPPQCVDPKTKNRSRVHWWLADQQSHEVDPRALSLLLDLDGNITESAGANFVIIKDKTIYSPTSRNILQGVSLRTVRELARELGYAWVEKDMQEYDVIHAQEAWLTNTSYCIAPAVKINNKAIGDGKIGPHYRRFLDAWSARVGLDIYQQITSQCSAGK